MTLTKSDILTLPHHEAIGFDGLKNFTIAGISINSRTIRAGDLFIAIRGTQFDGHNFVSKAIEMGACAIIVERRWAESNATMMVSIHIPRIVVEDSIHAFGQLANKYRRKFKIPVIAVGGSNGKTTTKEMIKSVLSQKYRVLSTEGNFNNHIGVPQTLLRLERKHTVAVVEIGTNHPGEIAYLCSVLEPTHGLITNIGQEHLEFFGSKEGVANSEGELFDWLGQHKGTAFINADDPLIARQSKKLKKSVRYGFSARTAAVRGKIQSFNSQAQAFLQIKHLAKKAFDITVGVPGKHNAQNALAASAVGLTLRVPMKSIQKALGSFQPASKRMQVQHCGDVSILNDTYNSNPDSMISALETLHTMSTQGKKIAILADMLELGPQAVELHQQAGTSLEGYGIDSLFTFGALAKHIHDAASVHMKAHFEQKQALIEHVAQTLASGDIILVKGSRGMKMEEVVESLSERLSQKTGN